MVAGLDKLRAKLKRVPIKQHRRRSALPAIVAVAFALSCRETPAAELRRASAISPGEGGSPVSLDSALSLFRRNLAPVSSLEHGESSVGRLVARLERGLRASDTAVIRSIVMSRREFAFLYFPTSPFTRPPTKQEPGLAWFLHIEASQKGATRLLNRFGGRPVRIIGNQCRGEPRREGRNVLWDDCLQTVVDGRDTLRTRLFGGVYQREGMFKILTYANDL
jgi:hypothetical protein